MCHEASSNVEVGHDDDSLFLFVNQFLTVLRRCSTIEMKSMERAKSFVASRSTVSGSRYKTEKTTSGTAVAEAAKNNKFKRSNSLVGVGHPNQSSHLDSKETGKHSATDITTCTVGCVCKKMRNSRQCSGCVSIAWGAMWASSGS